ncbi:hypothetical protein A2U01_0076222, partial [Trifolium medium]|nr:hypothetical protein [Trifolium medium]
KAIGVRFKGDSVNMFNVLSRAGKGKKESSDYFLEYSRPGWFREEKGGAQVGGGPETSYSLSPGD